MRTYIYFWMVLLTGSCFAQPTQKDLYESVTQGNGYYASGAYPKAQEAYRKAVQEGSSFVPTFNLGDAYYKQDSLEQAVSQFTAAASVAKTKDEQATAYHNLGNAQMKQKKYKESIDAYKEALRRNPTDEETRYNLSYAKKMLQNQQNKDKNKDKNKDQKDKDDKNKDQKDKDQNKGKDKDKGKGQDQKDKDKSDQGKQDKSKDNKEGGKDEQKEQQQAAQKKGAISKQQAESMLNALDQEEAQLRKGLRLKEEKSKPKYIDKDW